MKQARQWLTYGVLPVLLLATLCSPFQVRADVISSRSLTLSTSSKSATNVDYTVSFTTVKSAAAFVIDFCANSPTLSQVCNAPTGLSVSGATSTTPGFTDVTALDSNTVAVTGSMAATTPISVKISSVTNPSVTGTVYARIATYDTKAHATSYQSEAIGSGVQDTGGLAFAITDTIGVSGTVPESLSFCLSDTTISADCSGMVAPALKLGDEVDGSPTLSSSKVSQDTAHMQLSTNAVKGAVVYIKSDAYDCGGLLRKTVTTGCSIYPAQRDGIAAGQARFGVKTGVVTDGSAEASGTLQTFAGSGYNGSSFVLNYAANNQTGVTSLFGDPFIDTNDAPVNNKNMAITFGASVSRTTPAGVYYVDIGLIATGKF